MTKQEINDIIHRTICDIWITDIPQDYDSRYLLKEDTLKNAFYHYLRIRLDHLFLKNDIRIFTEFTDGVFKGQRLRPDIVIASVDFSSDNCRLGDSISELLCVIELKYKSGFTASKTIYDDYEKLRGYTEDLHITCPLYMATIWEHEDKPTSWTRKNAAWAKGKITELNASYDSKTHDMRFYVVPHK